MFNLEDIIKLSKEIHKDIINWRRELHQIPGVGFDIEDTYNFVKLKLEEMNIEYETLARTGISAIIKGSAEGPTIALRADMDALPIKEETGLSFASKNNCMHACGHDAHASMLLGAAKILSDNRAYLKGNVKLFFQPAEENHGGAKPMIEEGCMENPKVDAVMGLHIGQLFEEVKTGMIGVKSGYVMASVDWVNVKVIGKGGHGATPHLCVDPVIISSEMITSLQKVVSRETSPLHPAVLTIGLIQGGTAANIIPETVEFKGTIRTLYPEDRTRVEKRIKEICEGIAHANGAKVEITYSKGYPALKNNEAFTESFIKSAEKIVGKDNIVVLKDPTMGAEDMSYFLQEAPGTFFFLGSHNTEKGIIYPHHHPKFDVDEDVLWIGTAAFVQVVFDFLK